MLLALGAGTFLSLYALSPFSHHALVASARDEGAAAPTVVSVPTVTVFESTPESVPTVNIPQPTATASPTATVRVAVERPHHRRRHHRRPAPAAPPAPKMTWIDAYLTSYCPGSAGWISASGLRVFYGMLANNYYVFGTRVYLPVIGITGVVEDRLSAFPAWNHFDVWSPTCYGTPTGWFRVAVQTG